MIFSQVRVCVITLGVIVALCGRSADALDLTWNNASGNGMWDTTSYNWSCLSIPTTYTEGDSVTIGLSTPTITIQSSGIAPSSVTFSSGTVSVTGGAIKGTTGVSFNGGSVTLNSANEYTGDTNFRGGTLYVGHDQALSSSKLVMYGGSIRASGSARTISNAVEMTGGRVELGDNITLDGSVALSGTGQREVAVRTGVASISGKISGTAGLYTMYNGKRPR